MHHRDGRSHLRHQRLTLSRGPLVHYPFAAAEQVWFRATIDRERDRDHDYGHASGWR